MAPEFRFHVLGSFPKPVGFFAETGPLEILGSFDEMMDGLGALPR